MDQNLELNLVQWRVIPGDPDGNLGKAEELLALARPKPGGIILLPEMFPSGFYYENLAGMARRSGEILGWMSEKARFFESCLAGTLPTLRAGAIANTMVLFDEKGKMRGTYDKIHLFSLAGEEKAFVPGNRVVIVTWKDISIGLAVCFDLRFPEMARRLLDEGTELMIVSAQWPLERLDHFRDLVRVRAIENQFFVAACNSCGEDDRGLVLGGGSMVAGPSGKVYGVFGSDEGVLSLRVPLKEVEQNRNSFPVVRQRRKDLFK